MAPKPVVLIVLDGWGLAPPGPGNAVALAKTPNINRYWLAFPHAKLKASGKAVGLPEGEMGTSESGHLTLGAGRIVYQDFSRISLSIADGSFFKKKALLEACQWAKEHQTNLHLLGILSYGSVHGDRSHLYALLNLTRKQGLKPNQVKLHLFTDGRDSPPKSALSLLSELKKVMEKMKIGEIASLTGRYFAMDRDRRWERTKKAYEGLVLGLGKRAVSPEKAVEEYYQQKITDEFIPPTIFSDSQIKDEDALIFFNFRTDRVRQLTRAFVQKDFFFFPRKKKPKIHFVTMTDFEKGLPISGIAFPQRRVEMPLAMVLAERGLRQLHLAETEKYAFVTYYFNGMYEKPLPGEERMLIPSPKVTTYDQKPAMSSKEISQTLIKKIKVNLHDFILVNFANPDMVGHTGVLQAGIKACEVVDQCLGKIVRLILAKNGVCLIVADHGNVEEMINPQTGGMSTQHSMNLVPLIIIGKQWRGKRVRSAAGTLADVAPTILKIMAIPKPNCMTGQSLI